jgi:hypothetical protein
VLLLRRLVVLLLLLGVRHYLEVGRDEQWVASVPQHLVRRRTRCRYAVEHDQRRGLAGRLFLLAAAAAAAVPEDDVLHDEALPKELPQRRGAVVA